MGNVTRMRTKSELYAAIMSGALRGAKAVGDLVADRARVKARVKTGRMARSVTASEAFVKSESQVAVLIGTNVEYARAHEMGSGLFSEDPQFRHKIHIEAGFWTGKSDKKSLAFIWPGGPRELAADPERMLFLFRSVEHPGIKPQPFLRPALRETIASGEAGRLLLSAIAAELRAAR